MTKAEFLKLPMEERRKLLEECCTPEMVRHYEVTCPECGNYYGGHATGGYDICDCHERKSSNEKMTDAGAGQSQPETDAQSRRSRPSNG